MSGKIRSKDLAYDAALPPFLQRLCEQNAGRADPDRHERQIARPKLTTNANNDDDGPTVVDESGEIMTHKNFKQQVAATAAVDAVNKEDLTSADTKAVSAEKTLVVRTEQHITVGATSKKRKAGRVIADVTPIAADVGETNEPVKKAKRKSKPIKLAFQDNDEDACA